MKSMILKFGQHLLWQECRPSGCANNRFNSPCTCVLPIADSISTRCDSQVSMTFGKGSARSRRRLSPKISLNLKVSVKCSYRMLFQSEKVRSLAWLGITKRPLQAVD